jgi:hypothetical protein
MYWLGKAGRLTYLGQPYQPVGRAVPDGTTFELHTIANAETVSGRGKFGLGREMKPSL